MPRTDETVRSKACFPPLKDFYFSRLREKRMSTTHNKVSIQEKVQKEERDL
jgi:hypothetical protein